MPYTVDIPIPMLIVTAIILFLAGIVLAAWIAHNLAREKVGKAAEAGIYGIASIFFSSLIIAVLVEGIELPISGENWFAGMPFFFGEFTVCLIVFILSRFVEHLVRRYDEKHPEGEESAKDMYSRKEIK